MDRANYDSVKTKNKRTRKHYMTGFRQSLPSLPDNTPVGHSRNVVRYQPQYMKVNRLNYDITDKYNPYRRNELYILLWLTSRRYFHDVE